MIAEKSGKNGFMAWYFQSNLLIRMLIGLILGAIVGLFAGPSILTRTLYSRKGEG